MKHPWVCEECHNIVRYPKDRYTVTSEIRQHETGSKLSSAILRRLCRPCAAELAAVYDGLPEPNSVLTLPLEPN